MKRRELEKKRLNGLNSPGEFPQHEAEKFTNFSQFSFSSSNVEQARSCHEQLADDFTSSHDHRKPTGKCSVSVGTNALRHVSLFNVTTASNDAVSTHESWWAGRIIQSEPNEQEQQGNLKLDNSHVPVQPSGLRKADHCWWTVAARRLLRWEFHHISAFV